MNRRLLLVRLVFAVILVGVAGACRRSETRGGDTPITGKASDPPVTFVARWDDTNAFVYHLDSITGTPVPRRNSSAVVQQDTTVAQDLRLNISNVTRDGVRSLQMEIQSARVETTSDQRLTSAFDTENEMLATEDNTIAARLRRVKGARLVFRLAPDNRIIRVDNLKEFTDRTGSGRNVRGAAGSVVNKFFNQQFYRDLVEMSFLPTSAVHVGESWIVHLRSGPGLFNNATTDLSYTFRGWQIHEGTNCARFDFAGGSKSGGGPGARISSEDSEIEGTVWFCQGLGVPVEMIVDQTIVRQTLGPPAGSGSPNTTRLTRRGTNQIVSISGATPIPAPGSSAPPTAVVVETDDDSEPPPPPPSGSSPAPVKSRAVTVRLNDPGSPAPQPSAGSPPPSGTNAAPVARTTTIKQHVTLTLVELVPIESAVAAK